MRMSDWSSDVCSSALTHGCRDPAHQRTRCRTRNALWGKCIQAYVAMHQCGSHHVFKAETCLVGGFWVIMAGNGQCRLISFDVYMTNVLRVDTMLVLQG